MRKSDLFGIIDGPVISEKSTRVAEVGRSVVFRVNRKATKEQIKNAVELFFRVEVEGVRVLNVRGKTKRLGRNMGTRQDWKKAYVKLKEGFDIDFSVA